VKVASDVQQLLLVAATQAAALRAEGADVVVCLSHMGLRIDAALAANVPGLDAIVGGHDHLVLPQPLVVPGPGGRAVPIVQAGSYYEWVGKLTLSVDAGAVSVASYELLPVDATVPPFAPFAPAMQRIQAVVGASFGDVHAPVAFAPSGVSRAPGPLACVRDTGVGNLVTDAFRAQTGTDIAITANGLLPDGIAPGSALGIDLFRVVGDGFDVADVQAGRPFRTAPLYTLHVKGADLAAALETTLAVGTDDVFLQVSGMRYAFDSRRPAGQRLVGVEVAGEPLNLHRTYHATVDFGVVNALPLLGVTVTHVVATGDHAYDAVLALATRLQVVDHASQGRVVDVAARCE
jgi:5'-nucleotidase / UDP-sugar diphosphatase